MRPVPDSSRFCLGVQEERIAKRAQLIIGSERQLVVELSCVLRLPARRSVDKWAVGAEILKMAVLDFIGNDTGECMVD